MFHNIAVLGSTGSVGTQALDVAQRCSYRVDALSTNSNISLLLQQIKAFTPRFVCVINEQKAKELKNIVGDDVKIFVGKDGLCEMIERTDADLILNSVIGAAGLEPTLCVLNSGKRLALANKESLVVAGDIVMKTAKEKGTTILPVDSEHSAIFQCLQGRADNKIKKILLTASGGPFFGKTKDELKEVTVERALAHPTWKMGKKITVDSSTMMNKGFEIIEAVHLFGVPESKVEVVVHRESIIHSMVEFDDNAIIAQLGLPDMRSCIQYAVTYPSRESFGMDELDFAKLASISFYAPDCKTFVLLECARNAIRTGGTLPSILNASNEIAVDAFLNKKIGYTDIFDVVQKTLADVKVVKNPSLSQIYSADIEAREYAKEQVMKIMY